MTDFLSLAETLKSPECDVLTNRSLKEYTTFKTGGNAKVIVFPKTENALINILNRIKSENIRYIVSGNGSNLLFSDNGFDGVVIKTTSFEPSVTVKDDELICSSGASLSKICNKAYENGLSGLEFAYGIPGTVGGAIYMNAGAYGGEIKDVLSRVRDITPELKKETRNASEANLKYRESFYSKNDGFIITGARFKLKKGDRDEIKSKMDELINRRKEKQPLEYPSAGSTFKRPEGHFAGALIEQCGLKGYSIGGAQVSVKHSGFIINKSNASSSDIMSLINYVTLTVKEKTGVELSPEVKIID